MGTDFSSLKNCLCAVSVALSGSLAKAYIRPALTIITVLGLSTAPTFSGSMGAAAMFDEFAASTLSSYPPSHRGDDREYLRKRDRMHYLMRRQTTQVTFAVIRDDYKGGSAQPLIDELLPWEVDFIGEDLSNYYFTLASLFFADRQYERSIFFADRALALDLGWVDRNRAWFQRLGARFMMGFRDVLNEAQAMHQEILQRHREIQAEREVDAAGEGGGNRGHRRRGGRGGAPRHGRSTPHWSLETQRGWGADLQSRIQELDDLGFTFSRNVDELNALRESVGIISHSWSTRSQPSSGADRRYFFLLDQIARFRSQAVREMEPAPRSWTSVVWPSAPTPSPAGNAHRMRVMEEEKERRQHFEEARDRKRERRARVQDESRKEKEKELNLEEEKEASCGDGEVPVNFKPGQHRKFTQYLFEADGTRTLDNPVQDAAARMLTVFSYSRGISALIDNLNAIGWTQNSLNLEPLQSSGTFSVRVNRRYRICFEWDPDIMGWKNVWFGDYHTSKKNN